MEFLARISSLVLQLIVLMVVKDRFLSHNHSLLTQSFIVGLDLELALLRLLIDTAFFKALSRMSKVD